jgi:glucosamine--fructose-6-phosphate aminotransferase (isomerizing)
LIEVKMMKNPETTQMYKEAGEAPVRVADHLADVFLLVQQIAEVIKSFDPDFVVTCARGSSDHAATYAKYLIEKKLGLPVVSHAPSMSSVFARPLKLKKALFIAISQSGASPDLVKSAEMARKQGALTLAFVNASDSPLEKACEYSIPLFAGAETSVAATKSYILSLVAVANLVATIADDQDLKTGLSGLSNDLKKAWELDWSPALATLEKATNFFVVGRGLGLAIAQETALKFKETSGLHAEAYSAAEVLHGPMALVNEGFPILLFSPSSEAKPSTNKLAEQAIARGASVMSVGATYEGATSLAAVADVHPVLAPICAIQSFYRFVNMVSVHRGYDPDTPPNLRKVTETL